MSKEINRCTKTIDGDCSKCDWTVLINNSIKAGVDPELVKQEVKDHVCSQSIGVEKNKQ